MQNINEKVAVLLPCYNEEQTIGKVIDDFKRELPEATIYVYDNNSKDKTSEIARAHGAVVKKEMRQGKGNVVRSMFADIEADYYLMVDGDDTYPAEYCHPILEALRKKEANMVIGDRLSNGTYTEENKRNFHDFGNALVRNTINGIFKSRLKDIMTGYRGFDRYFVKTMPVLSPGFEIETEMSIHALENRFLIKEIEIDYRDRPEGSESKLNTLSDGAKVIMTIIKLFKNSRPFLFFNLLATLFAVIGILVGIPVIVEFAKIGLVLKLPSAILATGLILLGMMFFICGLILDTIAHRNRQMYFLELVKYKERNIEK
ncbi:glycosyltransferase [Listeria booriae]|uniref:Glycosyltransferase n=1 Tax=Listeria booriae TaxID=1552123 RepID=A0A842CPT4_9LIST|nr:glycosyltransferase family 2 protein [Listeria booriae]MBC2003855.1 glycosyltransferase [Listeria booriae]MBC2077846.1 glycosyltransferase [Listeria booriae]MBC2169213.1 glycosyltransferase [Listeria booriae]MBC2179149.1 glycosyltransferase [Listeria booriae]